MSSNLTKPPLMEINHWVLEMRMIVWKEVIKNLNEIMTKESVKRPWL